MRIITVSQHIIWNHSKAAQTRSVQLHVSSEIKLVHEYKTKSRNVQHTRPLQTRRDNSVVYWIMQIKTDLTLFYAVCLRSNSISANSIRLDLPGCSEYLNGPADQMKRKMKRIAYHKAAYHRYFCLILYICVRTL